MSEAGENRLLVRTMLRRRYFFGLSLLVVALCSSEIYIQIQLRKQRDDVHLINVAGNQRMLSTRIAQLATESELIDGGETWAQEFVAALKEMREAHEFVNGRQLSVDGGAVRDQALTALFSEVDERMTRLGAEVELFPQLLLSGGRPASERLRAQVNRIKVAQRGYLSQQIALVTALEERAEFKVQRSRQIESLRAALIVLVLLAEAVFIFWPADRSLGEFIAEQQRQKDYAENESRTVSKLNHELEATLVRVLDGSSPICANCKSIRQDDGTWKSIEEVLSAKSRARLSHGVCEPCAALLYPELDLSSSGSGHGTQSDV